jgi:uncharacterized protein YacL
MASEDWKPGKGMSWRVSLSIGTGIGWLIFIIVWLAFFASNYTLYQNISIFFASILAIIVIMLVSWASWGIKQIPDIGKEIMRISGLKTRIWASVVVFLAFMLFLILWFWYYAETYSGYQNIAIFIVSILVMGGILAIMWARWGMKYGWKHQKQSAAAFYHHKEEEKEEDQDKESKEE